MDPAAALKFVLPRLPLVFKTALLNLLNLSPNCDRQDARTEVVVTLIRDALKVSDPLLVIQRRSLKDPGIVGNMWISKTTVPAPDARVRDLVVRGIKELGDGTEKYALPDIADVEGEWTGYRSGVNGKAPRPQLSELEQYTSLMKETSSDTTILYFHGGAYLLMDPASHRKITSVLARKTGGRCFSVRYRLAPQHPFPSQLLDGLISYLYLLAPPEGSFHEPVQARNIVFAGDSAGGNLAFALLLLILTLRKAGISSVTFHGREVPLELPAGVTGNSPWMDISRSLPTIHDNAKYDYLEPSTETGVPVRSFPEDEIWPAKPPRAETFCNAAALDHPLVSPITATPDLWKGACPVFMCTGHEGLEDEIVVTARKIYQSGTPVNLVGFEGQPHCFGMIFPTSVAGRECISRWASFCSNAVEKSVERRDKVLWMKAFSSPPEFKEVDLATNGVPDEEVHRLVQKKKAYALEREADAVKQFEQQSKARL